MKIKWLLLVFFGLLTLQATAQITVVRVQNNQVYLDTSGTPVPVNKGDTFKVILSSEKLTNPQTGKDLGLLYNYSEQGVITEVQPLYAVGKLPSEKDIKIGQEAVIESAPQNTQTPEIKPQQEKISSSPEIQKITYEPIEEEVVAITTGAVSAPDADNIVTLSTKGKISVWNRNGENLQEVTSYQLPVGKAPLSVSAAKVRGQETAEVFVSVYEENLSRISTFVLAYKNGQWTTLATLPYFVKETGCNEKTVWMQRPFVLGVRPGNARNIIYNDDKFTAGKQQIITRHNWLSGLNIFPAGKKEDLIFTTPTGQVKLESAKGKTTTYKEVSVGAPNRVKYKQEMVKFYPALQVLQRQGRTQAAVVENTTKFGLLSGTFGQYSGGKIHFLAFEKGRLVATQTVDMDGFMYDTACTPAALVTAEVLQDGRSSIVEIAN